MVLVSPALIRMVVRSQFIRLGFVVLTITGRESFDFTETGVPMPIAPLRDVSVENLKALKPAEGVVKHTGAMVFRKRCLWR